MLELLKTIKLTNVKAINTRFLESINFLPHKMRIYVSLEMKARAFETLSNLSRSIGITRFPRYFARADLHFRFEYAFDTLTKKEGRTGITLIIEHRVVRLGGDNEQRQSRGDATCKTVRRAKRWRHCRVKVLRVVVAPLRCICSRFIRLCTLPPGSSASPKLTQRVN